MSEDNTWRSDPLKDGTFVEGIRHEPEHVHYDPRGGSDIPVNWTNQETNESINLRTTPLSDLPWYKDKE